MSCVLAAKCCCHTASTQKTTTRPQRPCLTRAPRARTRTLIVHSSRLEACLLGRLWVYAPVYEIATAPCKRVASGGSETALALDDNDADVHRILAALNLTPEGGGGGVWNHDKAAYHQRQPGTASPRLNSH